MLRANACYQAVKRRWLCFEFLVAEGALSTLKRPSPQLNSEQLQLTN